MSTSPIRLILASSSPQRKNLLDAAGYQYEIIVPEDSAEECGLCSNCGPAELVTDLATRKAADVARQLVDQGQADKPTLVVACDTVAECNGTILGKPQDEDHARDMLHRLRGQHQRVFSGLCLWPIEIQLPVKAELEKDSPDKQAANNQLTPQTHLAITQLRMDPITDANLEEYLESGLWQGKAGAFGYQDRHGWLHILEGSESNVIGLPMELLSEQLGYFGIVPT